MKRGISIVLMLILLFPCIVFAENNEWICSNCKRKNTTSFCPDCGAKRPEIIQNDNKQVAFQNDIEFGESKETILQNDVNAKADVTNNSRLISIGDIFEIKNFQVQYIFNEENELASILYALNESDMIQKPSKVKEKLESELSKQYGPTLSGKTWEAYDGFPWVAWDFVAKKIGGYRGCMLDGRWIVESENKTIIIDLITYWPNTRTYKNETLYLGFKAINSGLDNIIANYTSTHKSTPTPKPTPRPTATINPEIFKIAISSLRIGKNSIDNSELYVVFQNNSDYTIDRIDFNVICYDAYGRKIRGYNYYDSTDCYFDDRNIKPGGKTPSDHRWTLYGFDGTKAVDIVITSYHTTNGITVRVPESQWSYTHYQ